MMAQNFYRGHWNILYPEVAWGGPGPNYQGREFQIVTYIAANLYRVLGQHEWVGRSVAVAFGLWGIFALYQLTRRVWDDERALVSAALMSVLPGAVFIERSFLPDPAMVALVITGLWMLVAYCQTEQRHYLVLAALVGTLGILTKLPGIVVGLPAVYAIYALLGRRALERKRLMALLAAAASVLIIVSTYYLWARHLSLTYPPYHFAGAHKFVSVAKIGKWIKHSYFVPDVTRHLVGWMWTLPVIVLVVIGLIRSPLELQKSECERGSRRAPWFFHWFGVALLIQFFVEAQHLVEDPQNMHLVNPFAAAMGGQALVSVSEWIYGRRYKSLRVAGLIGIVALIALLGRQQLGVRYKPSYEHSYRIGTTVSKIADSNDLIVSFGLNPVTIYYSRLRGWLFPPTEMWHTPRGWDYGQDDIDALKSLWEQGARWLAISNSNDEYKNARDLKEGRSELWKFIETNFELYDESEDGMIFRLPAYPSRSTSEQRVFVAR